MSLRVARETIMQEEFDSGSLTPLCSIVHFVQQPGLYIGQVTHGDDVVGTFRLQAVGDGCARQVNVDLATVRGTQTDSSLVLAPGAVAFYSSYGAIGYAVKLWRADGARRTIEFDSRKLGADDLFTVTLLQPGDYDVADENDRSLCSLYVAERKRGKKPYRAPAPTVSGLGEKTVSGATAGKLTQAQTQVFRAEGRPRIKVRLAAKDRAGAQPQAGKAEWRRGSD